jgi:type IV pilus assembly PilN-like protein
MNWQSDDDEDLPLVVERMDRSFNWNYLIFIICMFLAYKYWPAIEENIPTIADSNEQIEQKVVQREKKRQQALATKAMSQKRNISISALKKLSVEGVVVEKIFEDDSSITIIGYAQSNQKIALYMRLIHSEIAEPNLNWIKSDERNKMKASSFSLKLKK